VDAAEYFDLIIGHGGYVDGSVVVEKMSKFFV
jgi:hypothetical protein